MPVQRRPDQMLRNIGGTIKFSSVRSLNDWDWLLTHATQSYYFHNPHVVLNENGKFVGYFTNDAKNPGRLKKASYSFESRDIHTFFSRVY